MKLDRDLLTANEREMCRALVHTIEALGQLSNDMAPYATDSIVADKLSDALVIINRLLRNG